MTARAGGTGWRRSTVAMIAIGAVLGGFMIGLGSLVLNGAPGPSQVAAGSEGPTPSASTSAAPSQSADATETATPSSAPPTPEPERPGPGSIAVVAADGLRLRSAPEVSASVLRQIARGREVFVVSGPTEAGGYGWYEIAALDLPPPSYGWAAGIGPAGEAWLEVSPTPCPSAPTDLKELTAEPPLRWVSCLGTTSITLEAYVPDSSTIGIGCVIWPGFTPQMLAPCHFVPVATGAGLNTLYFVYVDPSLGRPCSDASDCAFAGLVGQTVQIVAHFDDPAAASCQGGSPAGAPTADWRRMSSGELVLLCRQLLVVTEIH